MNTNDNSFLTDSTDPEQKGRDLARVAMGHLAAWMADAPTLKDRGIRVTVMLFCVRPDLIEGATLEQIGEASGRTKQQIHKLAENFRINMRLKS